MRYQMKLFATFNLQQTRFVLSMPTPSSTLSNRLHVSLVIVTGLVYAGLLTAPLSAEQESRVADAAQQNDPAKIELLLAQNCDVNAAQVDGMTALHWTVHYDDLESTHRLIAAGADTNATNRYGVMPLALACANGNAKLVELLLQSNADPNAKLRGGQTMLMTAARTGKPRPVEMLLDAGVDVDAQESRKQTAMMWAAAEGHNEVVKLLIAANADFETALKTGFTPFFFGIREGRIAVTKTFLAQGIDVNEPMKVKSGNGRNPTPGMAPLSLAIENGHFELAVFLLESGADPNDQRTGLAPLHRMIWVRKPDRGDNLDGTPPPIGSGSIDSLTMVRELVGHGADVNLRLDRSPKRFGKLNKRGATPFLMACKSADIPLLNLLLDLGADPTITNVDHSTPLMVAAGIATNAAGEEAGSETEAIEAIRILLDLGADIDAVDKKGETAMHGAAYKNFPDVARFLHARGAKIEVWNRANSRGWTPLAIASGYRPGNFKPSAATIKAIREIMLENGVDPPDDPRPKRRPKK